MHDTSVGSREMLLSSEVVELTDWVMVNARGTSDGYFHWVGPDNYTTDVDKLVNTLITQE